jgi:hypothetical protein
MVLLGADPMRWGAGNGLTKLMAFELKFATGTDARVSDWCDNLLRARENCK